MWLQVKLLVAETERFINCRCVLHIKIHWSCTSSKDSSVFSYLYCVYSIWDKVSFCNPWLLLGTKIRKARRGTKMQNFNSNGNVFVLVQKGPAPSPPSVIWQVFVLNQGAASHASETGLWCAVERLHSVGERHFKSHVTQKTWSLQHYEHHYFAGKLWIFIL